jgi:hypothetical protein
MGRDRAGHPAAALAVRGLPMFNLSSGFTADADTELEILIGRDGIARINIDGECCLRVRLGPGCVFRVDDDREAKPRPVPLPAGSSGRQTP